MTYRHCNRTCMDSHREDRRRGVCDFGAGEALAAFRFCSYCGTYAPSQNEKAVNVPGLPVWYTTSETHGSVRLPGFIVRAIIGPTGAMLGDVQLADGTKLERVYLADHVTDRTAEHLAEAST